MNQANKVGEVFPSLSVVIVNWNSKDYLRECLKSIELNGEGLATQVIVVDGASYDGCGEMLANEFPWVDFIQSEENIGFGRSNNLGAEKATGEYLLLLNPDTEIESGALRELLNTASRISECGIIGAKLLNTDKTLQKSCVQSLPTPLNQALDSELGRHLFPQSSLWGTYNAYHSDRPTAVEAVSGACMLIRRDLFERIGGFSPQYFMYAEDMDLCLKTCRYGRPNLYCPSAIVIHHGGGSTDLQFSKFSVVMMCEALLQYMRLNHGSGAALRYRIGMMASSLLRLAILLVALAFLRGRSRELSLNSFKRWASILSWVLGQEKWTYNYHVPAPIRRTPSSYLHPRKNL